jgi:hypothetical protein
MSLIDFGSVLILFFARAVWAPSGASLFGTAVDPPHPAQDYRTLRQVHLAAGSANPAKFRIMAQVVGHWPLELINVTPDPPQKILNKTNRNRE